MNKRKSAEIIVPIILINCCILMICGVAFVTSDFPGSLQGLLYGSGILLFICNYPLIQNLKKMRSEIKDLKPGQTHHERLKKETELQKKKHQDISKKLEKELSKHSFHIQEREKELSRKLLTWHEWMEFPKPFEEPGEEYIKNEKDFSEEDKKVHTFLENRVQVLFDKIKNNYYMENEILQKNLIVTDIIDLLESVAKIYNPGSEHPLLETSSENILRAFNRISLQLLVLLEQLPVNIKEYNLKNTYANIRTGVKAYGVYKSSKSYLPYVRPAYYLGRFALGSNPVSMGISWTVSEILKKGTQTLSTHFAKKYAINILHDMVFILGNEAATMFSTDYRHRDSNWIFGVELTELVSQFDVSREILQNALNEIGAIPLKGEYDRIFLYRCLAARKSANPVKYKSQNYLSIAQRQKIAGQLERFVMHNKTGKQEKVLKWKRDVEERLGIKLKDVLSSDQTSFCEDRPVIEKVADGLRSLAGFLIDVKGLNIHDIIHDLSHTQLAGSVKGEEREILLQKLENHPPMIYDYPDMELSDKLLDVFLGDLMHLVVTMYPHDINDYLVLMETVLYFRIKDAGTIRRKINRSYHDYLIKQLLPESPVKELKLHVAREIIYCMEISESPQFIYGNVEVVGLNSALKKEPAFSKKRLLLVGTEKRLLLLSASSGKEDNELDFSALWDYKLENGVSLSFESTEHRFSKKFLLQGGEWYSTGIEESDHPVIVLSEYKFTRGKDIFRPLLDFADWES